MQKSLTSATAAIGTATTFPLLFALSFAHLLNDMMQSLLPAIYPIIKPAYGLDFGQIGLISLAFQMTASLLQPVVGAITDRRPRPYSAVAGMACTLSGLLVLASAGSYGMLLVGASLVGTGSSIFHPEAVRMARAASGGRHGLAQSLFQVGGQTGQAIGPLLAAFIVAPWGQKSLAWLSLVALLAALVLAGVGNWYSRNMPAAPVKSTANAASTTSMRAIAWPVAIILGLMLSKSAYTASLSTYLTFYLMETFGVALQTSQLLLFVFLISQVAGSLVGGFIGDRFGRRTIIWFSILGALPFTLALPFVGYYPTIALTVIIGMIMASAYPAILVYALELVPGKVGTVAGIFYGAAFGLGALSAAGLGLLADHTSLKFVYRVCAFLPLIGLLAWYLPSLDTSPQKS